MERRWVALSHKLSNETTRFGGRLKKELSLSHAYTIASTLTVEVLYHLVLDHFSFHHNPYRNLYLCCIGSSHHARIYARYLLFASDQSRRLRVFFVASC